jgi:hypothetical protein
MPGRECKSRRPGSHGIAVPRQQRCYYCLHRQLSGHISDPEHHASVTPPLGSRHFLASVCALDRLKTQHHFSKVPVLDNKVARSVRKDC